jgi:CheY-like chemotaxis protein
MDAAGPLGGNPPRQFRCAQPRSAQIVVIARTSAALAGWARELAASACRGSKEGESKMAVPPEKRARVLLVEDEPMINELVCEAFEEQGFEVEAVENAGDALCRLMTGFPIDILFTDLDLPGGMDGAALARRARELRPDLPVIYTSGRSSRIDSLQPVDGSMFVPKPYDPFRVGYLVDYLLTVTRVPSPVGGGAKT